MDLGKAQGIFQRLEERHGRSLSALLPYLSNALAGTADPDRAWVNFERFVDSAGGNTLDDLAKNPRELEMLVTIFSVSPFLTEILLRTPEALELLKARGELTARKTIEQFQSESMAACRAADNEAGRLEALRRYQQRELLRIGTSDFLDLFDLRAVISQLSRMATGLVRTCLALASQKTGIQAGDFCILALGKLGGWELNYSSDIDLVFVSRTESGEALQLAKQVIENIAGNTPSGFLYRVDVRLRPWGFDGPLVNTLEGYEQYMRGHARLWEKQAFIKSRAIAGNLALGDELRRRLEPSLFSAPAEEVRANVLAMKLRTEEFLRQKGRRWGEVKLGEGSIRDIEFVVQSLQMTHPPVKTRATLKAIQLLRQDDLVSMAEARILNDGYIFLRTTEHYLQMIDYRQTYTLPSDPKSLRLLARRLGFEGEEAGEQFVERYEQHCLMVRSVFMKYVGGEKGKAAALEVPASAEVRGHLAQMDATYAATFSQEEIRQHARMAEALGWEQPALVEAQQMDGESWRVTVVGYDFLGEFSLICGLLFVYGMDITGSQVFTYEPVEGTRQERANLRRKIVDVFDVRHVGKEVPGEDLWERYGRELSAYFRKLQAGKRREAQGDLAKQVGAKFGSGRAEVETLYPIEIEIDNEASSRYTILKIETQDTVGFLYEFSNALALNHINIVRMDIRSIGRRVRDTIHVTDERGEKIIDPEKQRELRAAVVLIKHFTHLLPHAPNPEAALLHFRQFLGQLFERANWVDEITRIERPEVLNGLAKMLGVSDFLWNDFLRMQYTNLFPIVRDVDELARVKDAAELRKELEEGISANGDWRETLNLFKDREMFRIDMRHILGKSREFWDFSRELTELVELVIGTAFERCERELIAKYGTPRLAGGERCPAALFALGKFGGRELGFASDIELMLVYDGDGKTDGEKSEPAHAFYEELMQRLVDSIRARQEGIFHIDLQLRPYGKAGSTAVTLDAFRRYYAPEGPAWAYERQALIRLRRAAGDEGLGERVAGLRDQYVYGGLTFDVTAMRAMRERQVRHLVSAGVFNAKFSPGGLADVEYLVQGLQINHGRNKPELQLANTREAMHALAAAGILSEADYRKLRKAHTFLHWLIDSLRVVRGNTKDVNIPPYESEEFEFLARRLNYGNDQARLRDDLVKYPGEVQEMSLRLLG